MNKGQKLTKAISENSFFDNRLHESNNKSDEARYSNTTATAKSLNGEIYFKDNNNNSKTKENNCFPEVKIADNTNITNLSGNNNYTNIQLNKTDNKNNASQIRNSSIISNQITNSMVIPNVNPIPLLIENNVKGNINIDNNSNKLIANNFNQINNNNNNNLNASYSNFINKISASNQAGHTTNSSFVYRSKPVKNPLTKTTNVTSNLINSNHKLYTNDGNNNKFNKDLSTPNLNNNNLYNNNNNKFQRVTLGNDVNSYINRGNNLNSNLYKPATLLKENYKFQSKVYKNDSDRGVVNSALTIKTIIDYAKEEIKKNKIEEALNEMEAALYLLTQSTMK